MPYVWAACRLTPADGSAPSEAVIDRRIHMLRLAGLGNNECERLRHIRNREARLQSVGARTALLWTLLGEEGLHDWEQTPDVSRLVPRPLSVFGRDALGAPRLMDGRHVSLAHCQGLALAVTAEEGQIGVDVEPCDRSVHRPREMAERFFSPAEQKIWQEGGEDFELFLGIWMRKEALGKARGVGLDRIDELDTAAVPNARFDEISMDGYIAVVCQLT